MTRYTLVCSACHRGWEAYTSSDKCGRCGKAAEVRGLTTIIDLVPTP